MRKLYIFGSIAIALALVTQRVAVKDFFSSFGRQQLPQPIPYQETSEQIQRRTVAQKPTSTPTAPSASAATSTETSTARPAQALQAVNLAVPFQAQAPFAEWVEPFKEGCEEASLIMVDHYLRGATLSKQQMKDEILKQVEWQHEHFGGHLDLPAAQVVDLANAFYGYQTLVIPDLTAEKIKEQLRLGRPVIVPAAGRDLGNPNFRRPGPLYHMLVIKGYTVAGMFITNDPGTRKGADYLYTPEVIINAAHEWDGTGPFGRAVGIVLHQ